MMLGAEDLQEALDASGGRTPVYVYSLDEVRSAHDELRSHLPHAALLYYSLKANPHPDIVRELGRLGCGAEVSSVAEMEIAAALLPRERCIVTGPGKTEELIRTALDLGIRRFSIESSTELDRLRKVSAASGAPAEYLLRINAPSPRAGGLTMTGRPSQFGIPLSEALRSPRLLADEGAVTWRGLHFFPASNMDHHDLLTSFAQSLGAAVDLSLAHGRVPIELDLGGGFAATFGEAGRPPLPAGSATELTSMIERAFPQGGGPEVVSFESGRRLTASCGSLVASVVDVKSAGDRLFAIADAGINHLGGFGALRRVLPSRVTASLRDARGVLRASAEGRPGIRSAVVVGPTGAPPDVLVSDLHAMQPEVGDRIVIPGVGAYGLTASLIAFLGVAPPVEVTLDGGRVRSATSLRISRVRWDEQAPRT